MNALDQSPDAGWKELAPMLDEVMDELEPADRDAILLRYFERQDLRAVGVALGLSEDAAQKRVSRAVDKLRTVLHERRGAVVPAVALALLLGTHAVKAAPADLAARVGETALCAATAGGAAGLMAKLLTSTTLKLFCGAAAIVVVGGFALHYSSGKLSQGQPPATQPSPVAVQIPDPAPAKVEAVQSVSSKTLAANIPATPASNQLHLVILAADSGKPVPNASIEYRSWLGGKFEGKTLTANRVGECDVPLQPDKLTELQITTQIDGFADTRLLWHPQRGETIPAAYTLRLIRPVAIGGLVVDADNQPVAGAKVGFNHDDDPASLTLPENHEFSWIEASTDAAGRWTINRIAPEMIHRLYGSAKHPDHVEAGLVFASRSSDVERQLRDQTYTFHLGRPMVARGKVVDPDGVLISGAKVLVGKRMVSDSRHGKTDAYGNFAINGCRSGKTLITAEAPGFSAATLEVELSADSQPVELKLQRGKVLRLRVISQSGQPIPKASLWLDTMHQRPNNAPDYGVTAVQADFNKTTDAQGRMVWSNAPDAKLEFDIAADGYLRTNQVAVRPDGQEHVVTLIPAVIVSGVVRDADTGEPVSRFRIGIGWPQTNPLDNTVQGQWNSIERYWITFSGGKYRQALEEPAIYGMDNPGYILKFEAEGYSTLVSRVIATDEGEVRLDISLHPAKTTSVTVLLPDGSAAASADIGLVSPGAQLQLTPGGFSRPGQNGPALLRADAAGQFRFTSDPAVTRVVAAHPAGYAEATPAALAANPVLQLQAWGRLEGSYLSGGQPAPDRDLILQFSKAEDNTIAFDFMTFKVTTDAQGHFVFPQVPPGKCTVVRLVHQAPNSFAHQPLPDGDVEIRPGETTTVTLGGGGYTVKARLRLPDGVTLGEDWHLGAVVVSLPPPAILAAVSGNDPSAMAKVLGSAEGREYQRTARQFQAAVAGDNTITAENVPPGSYLLTAMAFSFSENGSSGSSSALSGQATLTVPADPPTGTLDAGEVLLRQQDLAKSK